MTVARRAPGPAEQTFTISVIGSDQVYAISHSLPDHKVIGLDIR
jgi:hypothetical protein